MRHLRDLAFAVAALGAGLLSTACDDPPADEDAGPAPVDAGPAVDAGPLVVVPACETTIPDGVSPLSPVASTIVGTIAPDEARVASPSFLNPASEGGELEYRELGYDGYSAAAGDEPMVRTDLGGAAPPDTGRRSIAYFVHMADPQIVDDESPTRVATVDTPGVPGGLRAQEPYLAHAMSAMHRTLTRIETEARPYDFGIVAGDCADSAQRNEMEWFIDLMNGAPGLHIDSGADDDPIPGPGNDPKDPFDPVAFPAPWLFVPGNHDVLVTGIQVPTDSNGAVAIGSDPSNGTRDYTRRWASLTTREIPADANREHVDRLDWVEAMLADTEGPGPVGHGFTAPADVSVGANYAYDAIPGLLRIITFDTSDDTGGSNGLVHQATVDDFLAPALAQAESDGVLVIVATHHSPTNTDVFEGQIGDTVVGDAVAPADLEALVAASPNVVAWLVGHNHDNRVRAVAGDTADRGYWEIMAPAIADYPSQVRVTEIVDNGNDTISIFSTRVDYDEQSCMEQRYRRLSVMEQVSAWTDEVTSDDQHFNVELIVPIEPGSALATTIAAFAMDNGHDRIETETTLRGL